MLRWPRQWWLPGPRGAVLPGRGGGGGKRMVLRSGGGSGGGLGAFTRWRGDLCCSHWGEGEPPWPISRDISIFVLLLGLLNRHLGIAGWLFFVNVTPNRTSPDPCRTHVNLADGVLGSKPPRSSLLGGAALSLITLPRFYPPPCCNHHAAVTPLP